MESEITLGEYFYPWRVFVLSKGYFTPFSQVKSALSGRRSRRKYI